MHILLTNDDGLDAPGLLALHRAIAPSHRISVVAPNAERSSCGHAATLIGAIPTQRIDHQIMGTVFAVEGTPVDCVRLAVAELVNEPLDWVISGINRGANVSVVDVSQSGTVAAAREAAFSAIPSVAVSQMFRKGLDVDWTAATNITARLLPQLFDLPTPPGCFWNVNIPALAPGQQPSGVCVVPLSRDQIPLAFSADNPPSDAARAFEYRGFYEARKLTPGTDVAAVFGHHVAVTLLSMDPTHTPPDMTNLTFSL